MKVSFLTFSANEKSGSYRIWVKDLSKTLNELSYESKIFTDTVDLFKEQNTDVVILCKSAYTIAPEVKKNCPGVTIGAINIPSNYRSDAIDFVIVGSPEEYTSMSLYENVFIYPLIERKFENIKIKKHLEKETLDFCFHGHHPHLFKFEPFLKYALEEFNKLKKVNLKVITGNKNFKWEKGKPDINVEIFDYDENFIEIMQSCDIGLVPNVTDVRLFSKDIQKITSVDFGLYDTDYFLRMKNKTNAGRAYVFYQLGIPVIHDMSPSSFELMSKTEYTICAHDSLSYIREFKKLSDHNLRNEIAESNKKMFEKHYNPHIHANKLLQKIQKLREE